MLIHIIIEYLSYLLIPLPIVLAYFLLKKQQHKKKIRSVITIATILMTALLIYTRIIEPNIILTKSTTIDVGFDAKIVLISDPHIGTYRGKKFLKRIVDEINQIKDVDMVIIAGDITYYPREKLDALLYPLNEIKYPTYAVLGNHDSESPGPPVRNELKEVLEKYNIPLLFNESIKIPDKDITLYGLGDFWAGDAEIPDTDQLNKEDNLIIIAHNPDTVYEYKQDIADLTLSGHTHGGQIRIPLIYKFFIPTNHHFDQGLYETSKGKVYVSSGLGMTGLPFRFGIPPTIDILLLK